ncbi:MAG: flippase [candidate division Zixibacteria bacterium]|nr:flippase [candidate division Zixibacteria bacterium]
MTPSTETHTEQDNHNILRNAGTLLIAKIFTTGLGLVLVLFLARHLGVERFGVYTLAYYFASSFIILGDIGLSNFLTREIARARHKADDILGRIIPLKIALNLWAYGLGVGALTLLGYPDTTQQVVLVTLTAQLFFGAFIQTFHHVFEGFEQMQFVAMLEMAKKAIELILCVVLLSMGYDLIHMMLGLAVSEVGFALAGWLTAQKWLRLSIHPVIDIYRWGQPIRDAIPYGLILVFFEVMTSTDTIMLAKFRTEEEVGWYGAGIRVTTVLSYVPLMVATAMFPTAARIMASFESSKDILVGVFRVMALIAAPIGVGLTVTAPEVIHLLYAEAYAPASEPLRLLGWSIAVYCIGIPAVLFLSATNRQRYATVVAGGAAAVNAAINFFLIPAWGMMGAATATLMAQIIVAGCCYGKLRSIFGGLSLLKTLSKALFAASGMGAAVYALSGLPIVLTVLAGVVVYVLLLWLVRAIHRDDLAYLQKFSIRRKD